MNRRGSVLLIIGIIIVILIAVGSIWYLVAHKNILQSVPPGSVACTQEAKQCPDGSYVGRTGPRCEFAACPGAGNPTSTGAEGMVEGTVSLSPVCPVERIPPDPNCAARPYQTFINISKNIETPEAFLTIQSNASGAFTVSLPVGEYVFHPKGGLPYPRCSERLVDVTAGSINSITINCDTGIR